MGLLLIHLLTEARLADFHSEVERLRPGDKASTLVSFPLQLETFLMEGSYNKVGHYSHIYPKGHCIDLLPPVSTLGSLAYLIP